jgi:hypothetical protein
MMGWLMNVEAVAGMSTYGQNTPDTHSVGFFVGPRAGLNAAPAGNWMQVSIAPRITLLTELFPL